MSPQRPSGRRFAAFLAVLAVAASAFGALVLPRFADADPPASMRAQADTPSLIEEKLHDGLCPNRHIRSPNT